MGKVIRARLTTSIVHHSNDFLLCLMLKIEAVGDVIADRAREQDGLLLDDSDLIVVPLGVKFLDIAAIEQHLALLGVIEALNEGDK